MRILVISNLYPPAVVGGYERRCADTVQWLAREHELLVLSSWHGRRAASAGHDGASRSARRAMQAKRSDASFQRQTREGARCRVVRALPLLPDDWRGTACAPLASLYAALVTRRVVRRFRPDLVFVWNASQIPHAAICAAHDWGTRLAFSVADTSFASFVQGDQFLRYLAAPQRGAHRIWGWIVKPLNRLPGLRIDAGAVRRAAIAWNSQALRHMTPIPSGITAVLERVIHPASFNEQLFAGIERDPAPSPTIAFVGRLEWQKAPDLAVRAVALLRTHHGIDSRLVLAGPGAHEMVRDLEQLAARLGIAERVQLRGALAPHGVAGVLAQAHALVVPSRWQEPFGLVCLEGALARVPIVASYSGGMPEMLGSGSEALFFPIDDAQACAEALALALTDREGTAQRVRAAFERTRSYSMERYRAAYDAFVRDASGGALA